MSRRQTRTTNSVSLFPFLAVLVCAMGALIFLLLITTRRIRSEVVARVQQTTNDDQPEEPALPGSAESQPEPAVDDEVLETTTLSEPRPNSEAVLRRSREREADLREAVTLLSARRDRQSEQFEHQQALIRVAKGQLGQSRSELTDAERRLNAAERRHQHQGETEQRLRQEKRGLEVRFAELQHKIGSARKQQATAVSKYAFLPFDGKTGTTRQPILIECTGKGLRFLPEGRLLTESDLIGFTQSYNPLLAGTRALIEFWASRHREEGEPKPYVLLIVRPSGSVAYYAARKLLRRLKQPFGYELLQEKRAMQLPNANPDATIVLNNAIEKALAEREKVLKTVMVNRATGGRRMLHGVRDGLNEERFEKSLDSNSGPPGGRYPARTAGGSPFLDRGSAVGRRSGFGEKPNLVATDRAGGGTRLNHSATGNRTAEAEFDRGVAGTGRAQTESGTNRSKQPTAGAAVGNRASRPSPRRQSADLKGGSFSQKGNRSQQPAGARQRSSAIQNGSSPSSQTGSSFSQFGSQSRSSAKRSATRRWSLFNRRAGIGYERQITLSVSNDRLVVGRDYLFRLEEAATGKEFIEQVVRAIEQQSQSWGKPPAGFYWVPALHFVVTPGGNQHYQQLHAPLKRFGFPTSVRFTQPSSSSSGPQE